MSNILKIDTSNNKRIDIQLILNKNKDQLIFEPKDYKSEVVLELIDKILKKNKIEIYDIDKVEVKIDSGSFTGIRVGASIANSLGYLLDIPINSDKVGQYVTPNYKT